MSFEKEALGRNRATTCARGSVNFGLLRMNSGFLTVDGPLSAVYLPLRNSAAGAIP
ncbi:hypothetical protein [Azospirillum endophyticum]